MDTAPGDSRGALVALPPTAGSIGLSTTACTTPAPAEMSSFAQIRTHMHTNQHAHIATQARGAGWRSPPRCTQDFLSLEHVRLNSRKGFPTPTRTEVCVPALCSIHDGDRCLLSDTAPTKPARSGRPGMRGMGTTLPGAAPEQRQATETVPGGGGGGGVNGDSLASVGRRSLRVEEGGRRGTCSARRPGPSPTAPQHPLCIPSASPDRPLHTHGRTVRTTSMAAPQLKARPFTTSTSSGQHTHLPVAACPGLPRAQPCSCPSRG